MGIITLHLLRGEHISFQYEREIEISTKALFEKKETWLMHWKFALPFTRGPSSTGVMTITEAKMQPI